MGVHKCFAVARGYVGGSDDGWSLCVLHGVPVPTRAEFTFIYQSHRCDHYNSSSPTQQDMEGKCGSGEREKERKRERKREKECKVEKEELLRAINGGLH